MSPEEKEASVVERGGEEGLGGAGECAGNEGDEEEVGRSGGEVWQEEGLGGLREIIDVSGFRERDKQVLKNGTHCVSCKKGKPDACIDQHGWENMSR